MSNNMKFIMENWKRKIQESNTPSFLPENDEINDSTDLFSLDVSTIKDEDLKAALELFEEEMRQLAYELQLAKRAKDGEQDAEDARADRAALKPKINAIKKRLQDIADAANATGTPKDDKAVADLSQDAAEKVSNINGETASNDEIESQLEPVVQDLNQAAAIVKKAGEEQGSETTSGDQDDEGLSDKVLEIAEKASSYLSYASIGTAGLAVASTAGVATAPAALPLAATSVATSWASTAADAIALAAAHIADDEQAKARNAAAFGTGLAFSAMGAKGGYEIIKQATKGLGKEVAKGTAKETLKALGKEVAKDMTEEAAKEALEATVKEIAGKQLASTFSSGKASSTAASLAEKAIDSGEVEINGETYTKEQLQKIGETIAEKTKNKIENATEEEVKDSIEKAKNDPSFSELMGQKVTSTIDSIFGSIRGLVSGDEDQPQERQTVTLNNNTPKLQQLANAFVQLSDEQYDQLRGVLGDELEKAKLEQNPWQELPRGLQQFGQNAALFMFDEKGNGYTLDPQITNIVPIKNEEGEDVTFEITQDEFQEQYQANQGNMEEIGEKLEEEEGDQEMSNGFEEIEDTGTERTLEDYNQAVSQMVNFSKDSDPDGGFTLKDIVSKLKSDNPQQVEELIKQMTQQDDQLFNMFSTEEHVEKITAAIKDQAGDGSTTDSGEQTGDLQQQINAAAQKLKELGNPPQDNIAINDPIMGPAPRYTDLLERGNVSDRMQVLKALKFPTENLEKLKDSPDSKYGDAVVEISKRILDAYNALDGDTTTDDSGEQTEEVKSLLDSNSLAEFANRYRAAALSVNKPVMTVNDVQLLSNALDGKTKEEMIDLLSNMSNLNTENSEVRRLFLDLLRKASPNIFRNYEPSEEITEKEANQLYGRIKKRIENILNNPKFATQQVKDVKITQFFNALKEKDFEKYQSSVGKTNLKKNVFDRLADIVEKFPPSSTKNGSTVQDLLDQANRRLGNPPQGDEPEETEADFPEGTKEEIKNSVLQIFEKVKDQIEEETHVPTKRALAKFLSLYLEASKEPETITENNMELALDMNDAFVRAYRVLKSDEQELVSTAFNKLDSKAFNEKFKLVDADLSPEDEEEASDLDALLQKDGKEFILALTQFYRDNGLIDNKGVKASLVTILDAFKSLPDEASEPTPKPEETATDDTEKTTETSPVDEPEEEVGGLPEGLLEGIYLINEEEEQSEVGKAIATLTDVEEIPDTVIPFERVGELRDKLKSILKVKDEQVKSPDAAELTSEDLVEAMAAKNGKDLFRAFLDLLKQKFGGNIPKEFEKSIKLVLRKEPNAIVNMIDSPMIKIDVLDGEELAKKIAKFYPPDEELDSALSAGLDSSQKKILKAIKAIFAARKIVKIDGDKARALPTDFQTRFVKAIPSIRRYEKEVMKALAISFSGEVGRGVFAESNMNEFVDAAGKAIRGFQKKYMGQKRHEESRGLQDIMASVMDEMEFMRRRGAIFRTFKTPEFRSFYGDLRDLLMNIMQNPEEIKIDDETMDVIIDIDDLDDESGDERGEPTIGPEDQDPNEDEIPTDVERASETLKKRALRISKQMTGKDLSGLEIFNIKAFVSLLIFFMRQTKAKIQEEEEAKGKILSGKDLEKILSNEKLAAEFVTVDKLFDGSLKQYAIKKYPFLKGVIKDLAKSPGIDLPEPSGSDMKDPDDDLGDSPFDREDDDTKKDSKTDEPKEGTKPISLQQALRIVSTRDTKKMFAKSSQNLDEDIKNARTLLAMIVIDTMLKNPKDEPEEREDESGAEIDYLEEDKVNNRDRTLFLTSVLSGIENEDVASSLKSKMIDIAQKGPKTLPRLYEMYASTVKILEKTSKQKLIKYINQMIKNAEEFKNQGVFYRNSGNLTKLEADISRIKSFKLEESLKPIIERMLLEHYTGV